MISLRNLVLGEMLVVGAQRIPAKLIKALAVISDGLHPAFAAQPWIASPDKSKDSCILCSLAARDFLRAIGFRNAHVRSVTAFLEAQRGGKTLHSLGVGPPPSAYAGRSSETEIGRWDGHMITTVSGMLIDTTLYQTIRPAWEGAVPNMIALPYRPADSRAPKIFEYPIIAFHEITREDHTMSMAWLDRRENKSWKRGADAEEHRRADVVAKLVADFGKWE